MFFRRNPLITLTFILFIPLICWSTPPENLGIAKQKVITYYDSGQYEYEVSQVVSNAKQYLQSRIDHNTNHQKLAIVFDLDDTLISTYPIAKRLNFGETKQNIATILSAVQKDPISPVYNLYQYAQQHHVKVFIITGRRQSLRKQTIQLLHANSYKNWDDLYLLPTAYHQKTLIPFKAAKRQQLTQKGYDIVFTMGDQYTDLAGGYADRAFKLPNPLYHTHV